MTVNAMMEVTPQGASPPEVGAPAAVSQGTQGLTTSLGLAPDHQGSPTKKSAMARRQKLGLTKAIRLNEAKPVPTYIVPLCHLVLSSIVWYGYLVLLLRLLFISTNYFYWNSPGS